MLDDMIADLKKQDDDKSSEKSSNMKCIGEPGVEIMMLKETTEEAEHKSCYDTEPNTIKQTRDSKMEESDRRNSPRTSSNSLRRPTPSVK